MAKTEDQKLLDYEGASWGGGSLKKSRCRSMGGQVSVAAGAPWLDGADDPYTPISRSVNWGQGGVMWMEEELDPVLW